VDLADVFLKLAPQDGDIVFFDQGAVDTVELKYLCDNPLPGMRGVVFIGISLRLGQSVEDAVFEMSKPELELLIAEKS
jgi:hypothetical protein